MSLDKFVRFMTKDHDDIIVFRNRIHERTFEKKTTKTIKLYFGFVKSYLRIAHGIKITTEDAKDYVRFPKIVKERRQPITPPTLKLLFGKCDPERRALYYVLISSGMRLGEGLSLKKKTFTLTKGQLEYQLKQSIQRPRSLETLTFLLKHMQELNQFLILESKIFA